MLPDPVYTEADADVDDVDEIDEPPSYLHAVREPLFGGRFEDGLRRDEPVRRRGGPPSGAARDDHGERTARNTTRNMTRMKHRTACSRSAAVR